MTDSTQAAGTPQAPYFQLQRLYLKDASLEMPNAPQVFLENESPTVDVQLEVSDSKVVDAVHEVVVRVTVTAKLKEKVLFLAEAKQGGIFEIRNLPAEQMGPILGIVCPGIVYPYLRSNIADLISRTGLPAVHLAEINFEAFYQQKLAARTQQAVPSAPVVANGSGAAIA
ncbi:MAG: protein-export chaperone SecB [Burkholderiaceae bacterium]